MENDNFLGRGWSFPPSFSKIENTVEMVEGGQDVKKGLEVLLTTRLGERVLHPEYGSNVFFSQFQPIGTTLENELKEQIATAISKFEHRVVLDDVRLLKFDQKGYAEVHLEYTLTEINKSENLVFPFYLETPA